MKGVSYGGRNPISCMETLTFIQLGGSNTLFLNYFKGLFVLFSANECFCLQACVLPLRNTYGDQKRAMFHVLVAKEPELVPSSQSPDEHVRLYGIRYWPGVNHRGFENHFWEQGWEPGGGSVEELHQQGWKFTQCGDWQIFSGNGYGNHFQFCRHIHSLA